MPPTREFRTELQEIFRDVFDDPDIALRDETSAADIKGWDSLNNVRLVVLIERHFKIRFSTGEVVSLKNVGELLKLIEARSNG
jgi:acyl carrier protein